MRIIIEKVSEEEWGAPFLARSIETKDKREYKRLLYSPEEYQSFHLHDVEYYHKEKATEIVYRAVSWTKKREEIIKNESYY